MASGRPGPCGRVVLKPAEGGVSRETGFVMGPFLEGSLVLESGKRSAAVTKRDAQVSGWAQFAPLHQRLKSALLSLSPG